MMRGPWPVWKLGMIPLGLLLSVCAVFGWWHWATTPIERAYLTRTGGYLYWKTALPRMPFTGSSQEAYSVLVQRWSGGTYLATKLTPTVRWEQVRMRREEMHKTLADAVYRGGLMSWGRLPVFGGLGLLVACFITGVVMDVRRRNQMIEVGTQISGRRFQGVERFSRFAGKDALEIRVDPFEVEAWRGTHGFKD